MAYHKHGRKWFRLLSYLLNDDQCRKRRRKIQTARRQIEMTLRRCRAQSLSQGMDATAFKTRWLEEFAPNLPQEYIEEYVNPEKKYGDYLWNVFLSQWVSEESKDILPPMIPREAYLLGDEARRAYLKADKEGAIFIEPFEEMNSCLLPSVLTSTRMIDEICTEVYIVAEDFSWTYIKTHEGDPLGPYFYQKK